MDRYLCEDLVREDSTSLSFVNVLYVLGFQLVDTLVLVLGLHILSNS